MGNTDSSDDENDETPWWEQTTLNPISTSKLYESAAMMSKNVYDESLKKGDTFVLNSINWVCYGVYTGTGSSVADNGKFSLWKGSDDSLTHYAICIRGTNDPVDWMTNFDVLYANIDANSDETAITDVHQGFRDRLIELMLKGDNGNAVQKFLKESARPNCEILCAGHSLGGALAELFSQMLVQGVNGLSRVDRSVVSVVTFGQPRVYTPHSKKIDVNTARYVNTDYTLNPVQVGIDPVPLIPPGYIWGSDEAYELRLEIEGEVTKVTQKGFPADESWALDIDTDQHHMDEYNKRLTEITKVESEPETNDDSCTIT